MLPRALGRASCRTRGAPSRRDRMIAVVGAQAGDPRRGRAARGPANGRYCTVMVTFMFGWTVQVTVYVPALVNV
jgi:hypothetical protein